MSYWSNNVELYDQLIIEEMIKKGLATEDEDDHVILDRWDKHPDSAQISGDAESTYWSGLADIAKLRKDKL